MIKMTTASKTVAYVSENRKDEYLAKGYKEVKPKAKKKEG